MAKIDSIDLIEALFPIDSEYPDTNEVGQKLLIEAIKECEWRDLPEEILEEYARLCKAEEHRQETRSRNKLKGLNLKGR